MSHFNSNDIDRKILGVFIIYSICLGALFAGGISDRARDTQSSVSAPLGSASSGWYSDHMVFIILENHPLTDVTCAGCAPYMMSLGAAFASGTDYVGPVSYSWKPSLPNYLGLFSGKTWGCTSDPNPNSGCTTSPWTCSNPCNMVDMLSTTGISWKGYMEGMPGSDICNGNGASDGGTYYVAHHNPFVYFGNIVNNSTRCSLVVPSGSSGGATTCGASVTKSVISNLMSDLNGTAPDFSWVTPNRIDDSHDCDMQQASSWLSIVVPAILTTKTFETDTSATVVITFDEPTVGTYGTTPVYFAVVGPGAKTHYSSSTKYTHLNWLATTEANWSLGCLVASGDCGAKLISEFFLTGGSKLLFTTASQTLVAGSCSLRMNVQAQNSSGNPLNMTTSTLLGLNTSSSGGAFFSDSACASSVNSATLAPGTNTASFFYRDTKAGSATITASNTRLMPATQAETVNSAAPAELAFTTAALTTKTGICSAGISVQTLDPFGNPTTAGANVSLSTSSSGGTAYSDATCSTATSSIKIHPGTSSASFFYKDAVVGSPTIVASAAGLTRATQTETIVAPTSSSSSGGFCLQCVARGLSLRSLLLIGLAAGLLLTAAIMMVARRRSRRAIRRLLISKKS